MDIPIDRSVGYRLSPQQRRFWRLHQEKRHLPSLARCIISIEGDLNVELLHAAICDVVRRHEILRTVIREFPGMRVPLQIVGEDFSTMLNIHKFADFPSMEQERRIEELFQQLDGQSSGPKNGPALSSSLIVLNAREHLLLVALPAFCGDRTSLQILAEEICRAYEAGLSKRRLSTPPIQYADIAEYLNSLLESEEAEKEKERWSKILESAPSELRLPWEKQLAEISELDLSCAVPTFRPSDAVQVKAPMPKRGVKPAPFFLTCWQLLLQTLTGESEFIIGLACDGRTRKESRQAQGPLTRYYPIRCRLETTSTFNQCLKSVEDSIDEARSRHEYFAWDFAIGLSAKIARDLFPSMAFSFERPALKLSSAGLVWKAGGYIFPTDRFKLQLSCIPEDDGAAAEFRYDPKLFGVEDIRRMAGLYCELVKSSIENLNEQAGSLNILGRNERRHLLREFSRGRRDDRRFECFHKVFERQAVRFRDKIAVSCENYHLTYGELNCRANRLATRLRFYGVGCESRVGVLLPRTPELLVALLGVLKAGGAYVPLDPAYPDDRLGFMIDDSQITALLTPEGADERFPAYDGIRLCPGSKEESSAQAGEANLVDHVDGQNAAYIIYTSGSTGKPKGAIIEHKSLVNYLNWVNEHLLDKTEFLPSVSSLSFDASLKQLLAPLMRGGEVWIIPDEVLTRPAALLQALGARPANGFNCVPTLWDTILRYGIRGQDSRPLKNLTSIFLGGERLGKDIVRRTLEFLPHLSIWNLYGPTETTANSTAANISSEDEITIGRPLANTECYVLVPQMRPAPIDVPGELYIAGNGLARCYLGRREHTAERFIPSPFSGTAGARLYRTGDLASYSPDGNIKYIGRVDHQVKIRGFRIEPQEIEIALLEHPSVQEALVVAREGALQVENCFVCYMVVADPEDPPSAKELRSFLLTRLPAFMLPSVFVSLDALPLTFNGKVARRTLSATEPIDRLAQAFVEPETNTERAMAAIWRDLLKLERISLHENFFELGGNSLLAIQLMSTVQDLFKVEIGIKSFFAAPTVAQFSAIVQSLASRRLGGPGMEDSLAQPAIVIGGTGNEE